SGKLYDVDRLGNQVGCARSEDVDSQHTVRVRVGNDLDPTVDFIHATGPPIGREWKLADAIFLAALLGLFFGQPDAGDLRPGINHAGNGVVIDASLLSRQALGETDAFVLGLVGQHGTGNQVADCVNALHI